MDKRAKSNLTRIPGGKKGEFLKVENIDPDKVIIKTTNYGNVSLRELLQGPAKELKQAASTGCRAYADHCLPVNEHLIIEGPRDHDSEASHTEESDLGLEYDKRISATLKDITKWWVFFENTDYYWLYFLYEYDIPAPTCDAFITWSMKFKLIFNRQKEDAKYFFTAASPVVYTALDGHTPTWQELDRSALREHPSSVCIRYRKKELEILSKGSNEIHTITQKYEVPAGVPSKVYFGFSLDLRCKNGTVGAQAGLNLVSPYPVAIPEKALNYVSCAKDFTVNCYITSAICEVLGKGDNCWELNLLRDFRDNYLANCPGGLDLIQDYYNRSPWLLRVISSHPARDDILRDLYKNYLSRCIEMVARREYEAAVELYKNMVEYFEKIVTKEETLTAPGGIRKQKGAQLYL